MAERMQGYTETRAMARPSLMLRSAKLVCQSGEYLCIIRDVSTQGVGLRFMHAVPPETRTILSLSNGATYPVECVWSDKGQAGYRFARPIDLAAFLREPSPFDMRPVRLDIGTRSVIEFGRKTYYARMIDLSCKGAKIDCEERFSEGTVLTVQLESVGTRKLEVCWRDGALHGLMFQQPLTNSELANIALALQPFAGREPISFGRRSSAA